MAPVAWLDEARRRLGVALFLSQHGHHPDAVARSFYVVLAATQALLIAVGETPRRNPARMDRLTYHYVRTGRLDQQHRSAFHRLLERRMEVDYEGAPVDKDEARAVLDDARAFVEAAEQALQAEGNV